MFLRALRVYVRVRCTCTAALSSSGWDAELKLYCCTFHTLVRSVVLVVPTLVWYE